MQFQGSRENMKLRREPIPGLRTHHEICSALLSGGMGKLDKEKTLLGKAKRSWLIALRRRQQSSCR